jgi:hypothetical protein
VFRFGSGFYLKQEENQDASHNHHRHLVHALYLLGFLHFKHHSFQIKCELYHLDLLRLHLCGLSLFYLKICQERCGGHDEF